MVRASDQLRFTVSLPQGWHSLSPTQSGGGPNIAGLVGGLGLSGFEADRLAEAASAAWKFAENGFSECSERWILVRDPEVGRVDAVLSLDLHAAPDPAGAGLYLTMAEHGARGDDGIEVINRRCERLDLDVGVAIVVHDFALPEPGEDGIDPVSERAVVGLFVAEVPILAEFSLVTQDLGLTDDIVAELLEIARSFRIGEVA